ncbi:MAG: DsbA family protein [Candidatus Paceibacteria bacterium]
MEDNITTQNKKLNIQPYLIPLAILGGAMLIAGAVIFTSGQSATVSKPVAVNQPPTAPADTGPTAAQLDSMTPVTAIDHIKGDINAPVKIVEYSDTECPFCKRFHSTMQAIVDDPKNKRNVAWVYRHFPLDQLHQKARKEAEATECAAELGGNDGFWKYLDRMMEITPANDGLDVAELPKIAAYAGLNVTAFNECLASGRHAATVEAHVQNAIATGGRGTPWSIVVGPDGKKYPLNGALPQAAIQQLIDAALGAE